MTGNTVNSPASFSPVPTSASKTAGAALFHGRQAGTASAVALPAQACSQVTVKALAGNSAALAIGGAGVAAGTGFELSAGQTITFQVNNLSEIFIIGTGGSVCWVGC